MAERAAEFGRERRRHLDLAEHLRHLRIRHIEDLEACSDAAQIREIVIGDIYAVDISRIEVIAVPAVDVMLLCGLGLIAEELPRVPPASGFDRISRI